MRWTIRCSASIKMPESLAKECAHKIQVCREVWRWALCRTKIVDDRKWHLPFNDLSRWPWLRLVKTISETNSPHRFQLFLRYYTCIYIKNQKSINFTMSDVGYIGLNFYRNLWPPSGSLPRWFFMSHRQLIIVKVSNSSNNLLQTGLLARYWIILFSGIRPPTKATLNRRTVNCQLPNLLPHRRRRSFNFCDLNAIFGYDNTL